METTASREDRILTVPNVISLIRLLCVPLFLASHAEELSWHAFAGFCAWGFVIPGLILSWYAAITYIPMARRALIEGRVGSGP